MAKRAPPLLSSRQEHFYRHYCVPVAVAVAIEWAVCPAGAPPVLLSD